SGGGEVYVPPFRFRAVCDLQTGVYLAGDGYQSQIYAVLSGPNAVGPTRPIIGSGGKDLWYHGVRNLAIIGGRLAGTHERGIELISTNGDAHNAMPGGGPSDPKPRIANVYVQDTGAEGVYVGTNMRGARIDDLRTLRATGSGLHVRATDSWFSDISVGATVGPGAGILVEGAANQFVNCKPWQGDDHGWHIKGATLVSLANCVSNDNHSYGLWVEEGQVIAPGFLSDGDQYPCYVSSALGYPWGTGNEIDLTVSRADKYHPVYGIAVSNVRNNSFRVSYLYSFEKTLNQPAADAFQAFVLAGPGSDAFTNSFEYATHAATQTPVVTGGAIAPDAYDGLTVFVTLTANLYVNPLIHRSSIGPGRELRFVFQQDATGGHTVTWHPSYTGAPVVTVAPKTVTMAHFVNTSATFSPIWRQIP
ncbi:MAG: hypothetical protein ACYDD7_23865, partial [Acidimicrobiales bacterium]